MRQHFNQQAKSLKVAFLAYLGAVAVFGLLLGIGVAGDTAMLLAYYRDHVLPAQAISQDYPYAHYAVQSSSELPMTVELGLVATQLQQEFGNKYAAHPDSFRISFRSFDGQHAYGIVHNQETEIAAWWLATKVDEDWRLIANRSDALYCQLVDGYGFPSEMVPECIDENDGLLAFSR
jgi:hypothetical protein